MSQYLDVSYGAQQQQQALESSPLGTAEEIARASLQIVPDSLVQWNSPLLVKSGFSLGGTHASEFGEVRVGAQNDASTLALEKKLHNGPALATPRPNPSSVTGKSLDIVDVLNSIVPPREFMDESSGSVWMQSVRSDQAGRLDVVTLQEQLDERLENWQARDGGICPVREELFSQGFDELLRQVTLGCEERGLLLLRVRDEIRMTIAAYQTLYHSSVSFGVKKGTLSELGMSELEQEVESLEMEKKQLETTVLELENRADTMKRQFAEVGADEKKEREDQVEFLKFQIKHLETFLQNSSNNLRD